MTFKPSSRQERAVGTRNRDRYRGVVLLIVTLATKAGARRQLIRWFDRYNRTRRHSHCGWRAPIAYEKINMQTRRAA
ncbi:MAG: integrase core domain-containing protein [Actinomycetota bacterium]